MQNHAKRWAVFPSHLIAQSDMDFYYYLYCYYSLLLMFHGWQRVAWSQQAVVASSREEKKSPGIAFRRQR